MGVCCTTGWVVWGTGSLPKISISNKFAFCLDVVVVVVVVFIIFVSAGVVLVLIGSSTFFFYPGFCNLGATF